ncbi:MAG: electron transport complex subunit RsxC [Termitinemataceae bacterium]|nr:MAG: electron transport complex subunit RsxC [Termitinemataceae bacterium]
MKIYSFPKGGISFNDSYAPVKQDSVLSFLPAISIIVLKSFSGDSALPIVKTGTHVEEGMLIARRQGSGSANIHSPVPGDVIQTINWKLAENFTSSALVIRLAGKFDRLGRIEQARNSDDFSQFQMRRILDEAGIVEMDGDGRPLCDIFSEYDSAQNNFTLLLRCVFDDPWLSADRVLCKERLDAVALGCILTAKASGAGKICIAVAKDDEDFANILLNEITVGTGSMGIPVETVLVSSKYPQNSDREIEAALRAEDKHPRAGIKLGQLLVLGPATYAAVYDAIIFGKPILDRYVAVGGNAVRNPSVLKLRIGSRIDDVFKECGGFIKQPESFVMGSPLFGRRVAGLNEPILKTTSMVYANAVTIGGKIVKKIGSVYKRYQNTASWLSNIMPEKRCISCGECRRICPASLDPEDLYKRRRGGKHCADLIPLLIRCNGCGCCESVCPSSLPLCTALVSSTITDKEDADAV